MAMFSVMLQQLLVVGTMMPVAVTLFGVSRFPDPMERIWSSMENSPVDCYIWRLPSFSARKPFVFSGSKPCSPGFSCILMQLGTMHFSGASEKKK